jgi:hypothetical protein
MTAREESQGLLARSVGFGGEDVESQAGFAGHFEAQVVQFDFTNDGMAHAF